MIPAPKVPGVTHGSSSNLVVGGMRVAGVRFGYGDSAGGATAVPRVSVDPGSCVATAGIVAGDCELSLAARDRVVRDEDICRFSVQLDSTYIILAFGTSKEQCFGGRLLLQAVLDPISWTHTCSMSGSVGFAPDFASGNQAREEARSRANLNSILFSARTRNLSLIHI